MIKKWIIKKWSDRHFNRIFNSFERMVDCVYKSELKKNPDTNRSELRLKMWNDLYNLTIMQWEKK